MVSRHAGRCSVSRCRSIRPRICSPWVPLCDRVLEDQTGGHSRSWVDFRYFSPDEAIREKPGTNEHHPEHLTGPHDEVPSVARHEPSRQSRPLATDAGRRTDRAGGGLRRRSTGRGVPEDQPGRALPGDREGGGDGPGRGGGRPARSGGRRRPGVRSMPAALGLPEAEPVVDCLVFADALEHMIDPWGVLARLSRWVRDGGQVLACIPNVQHYSMLVSLLQRPMGIPGRNGCPTALDLRFFTLPGIQDLFARAGLHVFEIVPRWWPDAEFDRFQQLMAPVVRALGIDASTFAVQTRAVQYLVRSVRAAD